MIGILAATYVTIVANKIQTQQVRPVANIVIGNYVNDLYVDLRNGGLGPLIVKSLKVRNHNGVEKINIIDYMPLLKPPKYWANFVSKIEERVIAPSDKINLLRFKTDLKNEYEVTMKYEIKNALSALTIEVEYTDIFGNHQPTLTRPLTSFAKRIVNDVLNDQEETINGIK
ncbi:MAG: hypothetical protein IPH31_00030 [Lewinellaceae bacterium]|nr:hypothetical protein [Lewinellaceae bacterium]